MLIFLYGSDTYRLKRKLREIIRDYKEAFLEGVSFKFFNFTSQREAGEGEDISFVAFKKEFNNLSLFQERKVIVLTNPFSSPRFKKKFLREKENFASSEDILIFCQEGEVSPKDELFQFLKEKAKVQKFSQLKGLNLEKWVKEEFQHYKVGITAEGLKTLISYAGNDMWQLANEIQKLASFKKGGEITSKDVRLNVKPSLRTDIFKTIEAISQKNKKRALHLLEGHLKKGDAPLYLFSMINFQFRNLLLVRDLWERGKTFPQILKQLSLHPLVIKKSYAQARYFSLPELKKIYQKLFQLDFQIKVGKIKPETALELFIAQM